MLDNTTSLLKPHLISNESTTIWEQDYFIFDEFTSLIKDWEVELTEFVILSHPTQTHAILMINVWMNHWVTWYDLEGNQRLAYAPVLNLHYCKQKLQLFSSLTRSQELKLNRFFTFWLLSSIVLFIKVATNHMHESMLLTRFRANHKQTA